MAIHAGLGGRNVRDVRNLDRGVTVSAIETKLADVEPVAVRNRLNGTVAHVCVPRGKVVPDARDRERRTEDAREGGPDRELVPPGGEDLGQWLGLCGAGGQLPRPRVRDGTVMPHPRPPKNSSQGTTNSLRLRPRSYPQTQKSYPQTGKRVKRAALLDKACATPSNTAPAEPPRSARIRQRQSGIWLPRWTACISS